MKEELIEAFNQVRTASVRTCESLAIEDYGLQAEAFTSPPKWHLAHTTWFFETFILKPFMQGYNDFNPVYEVLFNSYYNAVGEQYPRPRRGLLSRPTVKEVIAYRDYVDKRMNNILDSSKYSAHSKEIFLRCQLGIEHEKQHQELLFTDLKYSLFFNPLYPAYREKSQSLTNTLSSPIVWQNCDGGLIDIGVDSASQSFSFDNESPRHKVHIAPFKLAHRLVNNAEYQEFIDDGGYTNPEYWLSDGWAAVQRYNWQKPLYWLDDDNGRQQFTLYGLQQRLDAEPVCHISGYEADAYANWRGLRLPTEAEWEFAANQVLSNVKKASEVLHPLAAGNQTNLCQLYDTCWQWTSSAYRPYPGFSPTQGALGEYNGKFMCNQWVLRGGSCVSSDDHQRSSYRNFFYPQDRWQFSGIRLVQ